MPSQNELTSSALAFLDLQHKSPHELPPHSRYMCFSNARNGTEHRTAVTLELQQWTQNSNEHTITMNTETQ